MSKMLIYYHLPAKTVSVIVKNRFYQLLSEKKGVYNDDFSTRIDFNSTRQNDEGVKMQKITVSFPDEKVKEIMRIARERGESKSTILRMAMELYLRREKREKGDELLIL